MMSVAHNSEDEFDALPDITAGVDFDSIPALCTPVRCKDQRNDNSSEYSFDELNDEYLVEVDRIEALATIGEDTPVQGSVHKGPQEFYV